MAKLLNILFLLLPLSLFSQQVSFKATAPREVGEGQRFSIQYTVKADKYADKLILPDFKNLSVITTSKGTGTSTSVTIINGKMKSQSTYTTSWDVYVEAGKIGKVTVPPATVTLNGKKYKSNSLTISIVKSSGTQKNQGNYSNQIPFPNFQFPSTNSTNNSDISYKSIFFNVTLNKSEVYVGEPVFLSCRVFIQPRYQVQLEEFKPPSFDKIWAKQLDLPKQPRLTKILFNNKNYLSAILDKQLLYPQSSGELTIPSYTGEFSLYDSWGFPIGNKSIKSAKKKIIVKPLPAGKPQNFSGAIGNFNVEFNVDNPEVKVNDPINFEIKIKGTGNFGLFEVPQISLPKTFEPLNPDEKDNTNITENGISGTKIITYSFIARVPGNYKIPPLSFSYFDYHDKKYHTIVSDTFNIKVTGSANTTTTTLNTNNEEEEIGKDIRFIKTGNANLKPKNNFIFKSNWTLFFVYLGIIVLFLIIMFILRKKIKENADLRTVKFKKADKVSRKRLKKAYSFMQQEQKDNFYEETLNALWGYVSDKLNIDESELTRDNLKSVFAQYNINENLQNDFINLIDKVETSRYAPVDIKQNMNNIYNEAKDLINKFEKIIIKS